MALIFSVSSLVTGSCGHYVHHTHIPLSGRGLKFGWTSAHQVRQKAFEPKSVPNVIPRQPWISLEVLACGSVLLQFHLCPWHCLCGTHFRDPSACSPIQAYRCAWIHTRQASELQSGFKKVKLLLTCVAGMFQCWGQGGSSRQST